LMRSSMIVATLCAVLAASPAVTQGIPEATAELRPSQIARDTLALARLLEAARGASPFMCELVTRTVDGRTFWSSAGSASRAPLEVDSASAALVRWIHRPHTDPRFVSRLSAAMRDPDACVRRVAAAMLARVEAPGTAAALIAALDDPAEHTRAVAAIGLGLAETRAAVQSLVRRLRDPAPAVRRSAAWALGEIEDKAAMLPLIELLERDSDARVRQAAAMAIGRVTG